MRDACIVLFSNYMWVPKTVPLLELFSSKGGTVRFQRGNSLVPTEEFFSSNGGTLRSLGRKGKTFRTYDLILLEFHLILSKFHCLAYIRRGCAWRVRLPEMVPPTYSGLLVLSVPPIVAIIPSYSTSPPRCHTFIEILWMQYGLLFNDLSRDKNTYWVLPLSVLLSHANIYTTEC